MKLTLGDIEKFPKVELHRHLDGAVPKDVVRRIALRDGLREFKTRSGMVVPVHDEAAFEKFYQIVDVPSFDELLARFDFVLAVMQMPGNIEEVFYEATLDAARKNIWYVEWTIAPAYHTRQKLSLDGVVASALKGLERGKKDSGVLGKLILAIQREAVDKVKEEDRKDPLGLGIVRVARKFSNCGVAALGLVCNEASYPPEIYKKAFALTEFTRIKRTIHAGEFGDARVKNVFTSVLKLKAQGIGHGVPVGKNPKLLQLLESRGVRLETNPISNLLTKSISSIGELGLDVLLSSKIKVSVNSDDPILFQKELSDNFKAVLDFYGWGEKELVKFTANALASAFISPVEYKERLKFFRKLGCELPIE